MTREPKRQKAKDKRQAIGEQVPKNLCCRYRLALMCVLVFCFLLTVLNMAWAQQQNGAEAKKLNPYTGNAEAMSPITLMRPMTAASV